MKEAFSIIFGVVGLITCVVVIIRAYVVKRKRQLAQAREADSAKSPGENQ